MRKPRTTDRAQRTQTRDAKLSGRAISLVFALSLFCSGAAALVFQVLWIKQLSLVVGAEVYSVTIAVSACFAGLALGGAFLGRWADRLARPFLVYSILEVSIGALSTVTTILLSQSAVPFAKIESRAYFLAWVLPFLLVGIPAIFMGGTLPIAVRAWARERTIAIVGGNIYATNTAGGIAGALLSAFVLLPRLGVHGTAYAAAALNLTAAAGAYMLNRLTQVHEAETEATTRQRRSKEAHSALILYALAGGIALGYEVVWSQAIVQFLSTRTFAFSIVLATYLAGLATGSALYARFADRVSDPWGTFGFLISVAGLVALLEIAGLSIWQLWIQAEVGNMVFSATGSEFGRMCARFFMAALGIVFAPTVLLGAAFPAALQLATRGRSIGRDVGQIVALNTAGGIFGTLATGFFLVPTLGLVRTLAVLAIAAAGIGAVAVLRGVAVGERLRWVVLAVGVAALAVGVIAPADRLGRLLPTTRGGGTLAFYEESRGATVAVVNERSGDYSFRRLYIQGTSNSGNAMPSLRYMRLQALLPLIIHTGESRSALVIGFGTGITAGALLQYLPLQKSVCAELLPAVVRAGPLFMGNFNAGSNPKLQIRLRDGRRELVQSPERYDVITLEPPPPSAARVVNLYTTNFYEVAAKRLAANGLLAQWLPLTTQNDADTRSLVRSFLDVFPYATLWTTEMHETLLIGSLSPIELDAQQITAHFNQPEVASTLQEVGIKSPAALLATWMMDRDGLVHYAGDAPAVTDDQPRIEYAAWVQPGELTRVLPQLLTLRTAPPIHGADAAFLSRVREEQDSLFAFYAAGIAAYEGDRDAWQKDISEAVRNEPDNPYYGWILGNGNK